MIAQQSAEEVFRAVERHGRPAARIARVRQKDMAARRPDDDEPGAFERPNRAPCIGSR